MKKLWIVTVEFEFMAWAEDEREAENVVMEDNVLLDDEPSHVYATKIDGNILAEGWDSKCLVYHSDSHEEDITVQSCLDRIEARKIDPNQLDIVKLVEERSNQNGAVGQAG